MRPGLLIATSALLAGWHVSVAQRLEVVSQLGAPAESETIAAVRDARDIYSSLGLTLRKPNLPTLIVLLPSAADLAPYLGETAGRSRAFSFAGADRNYIVVAWSAAGSPLRAAAHEYAHLIDPLAAAPVWFREGFAEYLSYCERDDAGRLTAITPAWHLTRLAGAPWLPLDQLQAASRIAPAFESPAFYAQAWLTLHWLVSNGKTAGSVRPEDLTDAIAALGTDGVTAALHAHFKTMIARTDEDAARPWPVPSGLTPNWRVALALAEADRELGRRERAAIALERLAAEHPGDPEIAAAQGALALDSGFYDDAESLLRRAVEDSNASARTRYRLALMLLRPEAGRTRERARTAADQTRLALKQYPSAPDYRLALAQALMVDEQWEASAAELGRLAAEADWRGRAEEEMTELARRRQQALSSVQRPELGNAPAELTAPVGPLRVASVPAPPKPPAPGPMRWPPPGASIAVGRIDYVDCRGGDKIIVLRHPLLNLRFREKKGRPAKLFLPPQKHWTEIPCSAKGWTVNIAYYQYHSVPGLTGEAIAILF